MAPNQSKPQENNKSTTKNGIKLIKPPIGLERPKQESGKYSEKIKCRTNPADASSTTYEIPMEYFKEGTPEEWLIFQDKLGRCITYVIGMAAGLVAANIMLLTFWRSAGASGVMTSPSRCAWSAAK